MLQERQILKTEQKALEINLNENIYGTFAEIGAGQEVARNFFQVGAAAGTIAKTMSAYDKTYSDAIYGQEPNNRYVCESRVYKMLDHEYGLMVDRLEDVRPETCFFVFADSVAAINYTKTIKGQGWLGLRFQLWPHQEPNDLVLHVKMLDKDNRLQQEAIGVLGVNMIYACYFYHNDLESLVESLLDGLRDRISVDFLRLTGPDFKNSDNRLLALYLVKHGLTEVAAFDSNRDSVHPSNFCYKKGLMVVRGHFSPPTKVTQDVIESSFKQFKQDYDFDEDECRLVTEMTLDNLTRKGTLDERDFLDRADMLNELGLMVMVSNCNNHQKLINYLHDFKVKKLGLVIGLWELSEIINKKYEENKDGRLLVAFGELFTRNIKIYVYPALEEDSNDIITARTLMVPDGIHFLYKHLIDSEQIVDVEGYNAKLLDIFPQKVYNSIVSGDDWWETALPTELVALVKQNGAFNYPLPSPVAEL